MILRIRCAISQKSTDQDGLYELITTGREFRNSGSAFVIESGAVSFHRHQPHDAIVVTRRRAASVTVRSRKVNKPVGTLSHLANAAVLLFQQILLTYNPASIKYDANDSFTA